MLHTRIKKAREQANLSLRQAGALIGVSHVSVEKWEKEGPPEARLPVLASTYGVSEHWLRTGQPAADISDMVALLGRAPIPADGRARLQEMAESLAMGVQG